MIFIIILFKHYQQCKNVKNRILWVTTSINTSSCPQASNIYIHARVSSRHPNQLTKTMNNELRTLSVEKLNETVEILKARQCRGK